MDDLLTAMGNMTMVTHAEGIQTSTGARVQIGPTINLDRPESCLKALGTTNPTHDKKRIEEKKGELLESSYRWILRHPRYQTWRSFTGSESRLFWISGDPGKGKTMLFCGIINDLTSTTRLSDASTKFNLSYFLCEADDDQRNSATAILRNLVYMLVAQQESLIRHVQNKYNKVGPRLFEDVNAWTATCEIMDDILQDADFLPSYLCVDALDECITERRQLLRYISKTSQHPSHTLRWIVTSRNSYADIDEMLQRDSYRLSLENEGLHVSAGIVSFIDERVQKLSEDKSFEASLEKTVREYLLLNAGDTFLWAALVLDSLAHVPMRRTMDHLQRLPAGLGKLYRRMLAEVTRSVEADVCYEILRLALLALQPLSLADIAALCNPVFKITPKELPGLVKECGSFLTIRNEVLYIVHQSAADFLNKEVLAFISSRTKAEAHMTIINQSLFIMNRTLMANIHNLQHPAAVCRNILPHEDPLTPVRYACLHWITHISLIHQLCETDHLEKIFENDGFVHRFLQTHFLHWLESIILLRSYYRGLQSLHDFTALAQQLSPTGDVAAFLQDALWFVKAFAAPIKNYPLQIYTSGLTFSPLNSIVRQLFQNDRPKWLRIISEDQIPKSWTPLPATLTLGTKDYDTTGPIYFLPDGPLLAVRSTKGVNIWNTVTEENTYVLKHSNPQEIAVSPDAPILVSVSQTTAKRWDLRDGRCLSTLQDTPRLNERRRIYDHPKIQFLPGKHGYEIAQACDKAVVIWNIETGISRGALLNFDEEVDCIAMSPDGQSLAASAGHTVNVWGMACGRVLQTIGTEDTYNFLAFSPNSTLLVVANSHSVNLWGRDSDSHIWTRKGTSREHGTQAAFSPDSTLLMVAPWGRNDYTSEGIAVFKTQSFERIGSIGKWVGNSYLAFSSDGAQLARLAPTGQVHIVELPKHHTWDFVAKLPDTTGQWTKTNLWFSADGSMLAAAPDDRSNRADKHIKGRDIVKLWDPRVGQCKATIDKLSCTAVFIKPDNKYIFAVGYKHLYVTKPTTHSPESWSYERWSGYRYHDKIKIDDLRGHSIYIGIWVGIWENNKVLLVDFVGEFKPRWFDWKLERWGTALDPDLQGHIDKLKVQFQGRSALPAGFHLERNDGWLRRGQDKIVWLPSWYRARSQGRAVHESCVAISMPNLEVLFLDLSGFDIESSK